MVNLADVKRDLGIIALKFLSAQPLMNNALTQIGVKFNAYI